MSRSATHTSSARGPEVASRVGIALGITIAVCFGTGLLSHGIQHPPSWFWWPAHPVWLYRFTQGAHVISGVAAIPLLLVKLWAVYPRLFRRPVIGSPLRLLERGSIAVLVGATIFQLATGLTNIAQWYPWTFFFPSVHFAMAYVAVGALIVHIAVKLPVIRDALTRPAESAASDSSPASPNGRRPVSEQHISRRAVLGAAWLASGVAALSLAGQSVPFLRWLAVLAPRSGEGPQGVPVNRSAAAAGIAAAANDPAYRLMVTVGANTRSFSRAELFALPQTTARLPIACVEGWSASAEWTGIRLRDLLAAAGAYTGGDVRFDSLERAGVYRSSVLPQHHVLAPDTLVALMLNGATLNLDHGFPCRLIAPSRPGVLQTKWLASIEVSA